MTDASHRVSKPTPQSVAQSRPPFSHTGRLPSAGTHPSNLRLLIHSRQQISEFFKLGELLPWANYCPSLAKGRETAVQDAAESHMCCYRGMLRIDDAHCGFYLQRAALVATSPDER